MYTFTWRGPWTFSDAGQTRPMPRGNYTLKVRGRVTNSATELESKPYTKVSLVEVNSITLSQPVGGAPLDGNPNAGGGRRMLAEATQVPTTQFPDPPVSTPCLSVPPSIRRSRTRG